MQGERLFTTGEAAGLTGIPSPTIRRYIKLFGEHFSEGARIGNRGRRYTSDDISKLDLIRHFIRGADRLILARMLAGHLKDPRQKVYDLEDIGRLFGECREQLKVARSNNKRALELSELVESHHDSVFRELKKISEALGVLSERVYILEQSEKDAGLTSSLFALRRKR